MLLLIYLTGKFFTKEVVLEILYKNKTIEKVCTKQFEAIKKYGRRMAEKIDQRIGEITAADSVELMVKYRVGRCHQLKNNRKEQFAVDLVHPYRLVFEKKGEDVQIAFIIEIVDYH